MCIYYVLHIYDHVMYYVMVYVYNNATLECNCMSEFSGKHWMRKFSYFNERCIIFQLFVVKCIHTSVVKPKCHPKIGLFYQQKWMHTFILTVLNRYKCIANCG